MANHNLFPVFLPFLQRWIKTGCLFVLGSAILAAGAYSDFIFEALNAALMKLFTVLDLIKIYEVLENRAHAKITLQSLPAMLVYGVLYCSLCLLSLYVYFEKKQQFLFAFMFYAVVFALCLGLIIMAKVLGDFVPAFNLARRLIEMVISPLPILLLVSAFSFKKAK